MPTAHTPFLPPSNPYSLPSSPLPKIPTLTDQFASYWSFDDFIKTKLDKIKKKSHVASYKKLRAMEEIRTNGRNYIVRSLTLNIKKYLVNLVDT